MLELNQFVADKRYDQLVRAAWAHIQFETIHPFRDGNERIGRALITQILGVPLPLSRYIFANRQEYYRQLDRSSWPDYFDWFLRGIIRESKQFVRASKNI